MTRISLVNDVLRARICLIMAALVAVSSRVSHSAESNICSTIPVHAVVYQEGKKFYLRFYVSNPSRKTLRLEEFSFGENMLQLRAESEAHTLESYIPLISPGVAPLILGPGKTVTRDVSLDSVFPKLAEIHEKADVYISWTLQIDPHDECFVETVSSKILIFSRR